LDTNYTIVVYLVFSAADAFNQLLYSSPLFERANEVHLRLGLIYKALEDFQLAIKVSVIESIIRMLLFFTDTVSIAAFEQCTDRQSTVHIGQGRK
jgi:hypothetical protein